MAESEGPKTLGGGETQQIDLADIELAVESAQAARKTPPPLPPEVLAAHVPSQTPPAPRSPLFFVGLIVAFVAVGILVGIVVAMSKRSTDAPAASPSAAEDPEAPVITIPTVEMDDEADAAAP